MAKLVVQHDEDPDIGIVLERVEVNVDQTGGPVTDRAWVGECTECGHKVQRQSECVAVLTAKEHVDSH